MAKIKELREMNKGELEKFLEEKRAQLTQLRFDITSKQIKNHREHRNVKRNIARIITLLKEMESKKENK